VQSVIGQNQSDSNISVTFIGSLGGTRTNCGSNTHGAKESSATVAICGIVSDDNFATLNWPQRLAHVFPSGITLI
jgi:hypothetical protein